jgi:hypothetical protein
MYDELTPGYGRDYKSKKEILADWLAGKDFVLASTGQYINRQDAETSNLRGFNIRYKRLTAVAVIVRNGDTWK